MTNTRWVIASGLIAGVAWIGCGNITVSDQSDGQAATGGHDAGGPGTGGHNDASAGGASGSGGRGTGGATGTGGRNDAGAGGASGSGGRGTGGATGSGGRNDTGTGGRGTGGAAPGTGGRGTGGAAPGTGGRGTGGATGTGGRGTGGAIMDDAGGCTVPNGCCVVDSDCRPGEECVGPPTCSTGGTASGVCKPRPTTSSECWRDSDCPGQAGRCLGAQACPCRTACLVADQIGTCGRANGDAAAGCDPACKSMNNSTYCTPPMVEWVCDGGLDAAAFKAAGCVDQGTNAIRYCCPAAFMSQCH